MLDGVMVNLFTILIGGAGLFSALIKFQTRQLHSTFLGSNPFATKAAIIDDVTAKAFVALAVLGLLAQAFKEIAGPAIPDRLYSVKSYSWFFGLGILATTWIVWLCSASAKLVARPLWLPITVQGQRDLYSSVEQIVNNDGFLNEQARLKGTKDELSQSDKERNFKNAEQRMSQIEDLLDLPKTPDSLVERLKRVDPYFK